MPTFRISQRIARPRSDVFSLFADIDNAANHIDKIVNIERLTTGPVGIGTRYKETREIFGKRATVEMGVTQFTPDESYTVEADADGTHYRSEFQFEPVGEQTDVIVIVNAKPVSVAAKLLSPISWLLMGVTKKIFASDIEDLKKYAENQTS